MTVITIGARLASCIARLPYLEKTSFEDNVYALRYSIFPYHIILLDFQHFRRGKSGKLELPKISAVNYPILQV